VSADLYISAMTDWLACAAAGAGERAARATRASAEDLSSEVVFAATAGHVLDFDDTLPSGLAHISAATAPAALVLAAHLGCAVDRALVAYAAGFEAMAALAEASHPALYDAGWHPTAVCGPVGAAVAASVLLGLDSDTREQASRIALLRAGGTRGAFGSDGKAIQVGLAAAAGVQAACLARGGARVDERATHGAFSFTEVLGARWPSSGHDGAAITRNWIKLHPSCLGTHAAIDAAVQARAEGLSLDAATLEVAVHPLSRQAAHLDAVGDGLSGKFSIPYCVAFTLRHGAPRVRDFDGFDAETAAASGRVSVRIDRSLPEFGAVLSTAGRELARVSCPRGAPERPVSRDELATKVTDLAGPELAAAVADLERPAAEVLEAARLHPVHAY
jgi:2-methylcitrate dehydratase PrpD